MVPDAPIDPTAAVPPLGDEPLPQPPPDPEPARADSPSDQDVHDVQANQIIAGGVALAAGMGWAPAYIDTAWLVTANAAMVTALAALYGYKWTGDHVRDFITRLMYDSGITFAAVKGLTAVMRLTGIGMLPAVAINGALNAGLALAIGKSAQHYFKNRGEVPDDELIAFFRDLLAKFGLPLRQP